YWNYRFADILLTGSHGRRVIDFNQFHDIHPISRPRQLPSERYPLRASAIHNRLQEDMQNGPPLDNNLN
ncbi:MAG: hypothetical protein ABG776_17160, partial [Cyanobacteria bacterium J06555_13]